MVNYTTAMDNFVIICFGSVFAALLEFAIITFISLYISRYKAAEEKQKEALDKLVRIVNEKLRSSDNINGILSKELLNKIQNTEETPVDKEHPTCTIENNRNLEVIEIIQVDNEKSTKIMSPKGFLVQIKAYFTVLYNKLPEDYKDGFESCCNGLCNQLKKLKLKPVPEMYIYSHTDEACEYIDAKSRKYFPSAFIFVMSVYGIHYLYVYQDETVYKNE